MPTIREKRELFIRLDLFNLFSTLKVSDVKTFKKPEGYKNGYKILIMNA